MVSHRGTETRRGGRGRRQYSIFDKEYSMFKGGRGGESPGLVPGMVRLALQLAGLCSLKHTGASPVDGQPGSGACQAGGDVPR